MFFFTFLGNITHNVAAQTALKNLKVYASVMANNWSKLIELSMYDS